MAGFYVAWDLPATIFIRAAREQVARPRGTCICTLLAGRWILTWVVLRQTSIGSFSGSSMRARPIQHAQDSLRLGGQEWPAARGKGTLERRRVHDAPRRKRCGEKYSWTAN